MKKRKEWALQRISRIINIALPYNEKIQATQFQKYIFLTAPSSVKDMAIVLLVLFVFLSLQSPGISTSHLTLRTIFPLISVYSLQVTHNNVRAHERSAAPTTF